MDPVTQGALGAACSQAILHPYDKKNAWIIGAVSGMAADLDLLIRSSNDPMLFLIYHRHFTHSLLFIPIGALVVGLFFLMFQRFRARWRITLLASLIGYATHALLDTCTSYGTLLFWPFSNSRYAWDFISIIDPFFTLPLVLGVVWTRVLDDRKGVCYGLILALLFLLINIEQHHRALTAFESFGKAKYLNLKKVRVFPTLASSTHWRGAGFIGNKIVLVEVKTPIFSESFVQSAKLYPAFSLSELSKAAYNSGQQARDFKIFYWFTDGYLIKASDNPLVVVDARYIYGVPVRALWGIRLNPGAAHVDSVRDIHLMNGVNLP
ncbi:metal-dependent hydrolase [Legionella impletisoli]|uniref:Membrane protein n=1 Tax=Legionella impletisoli TaxID=343510 RepID=A0A917JUL7_9GAMM|nr:metal-dependent hydrolase [Legionella impletisoli]GGI85240.1 membrane protein [Legionella impletisoli]